MLPDHISRPDRGKADFLVRARPRMTLPRKDPMFVERSAKRLGYHLSHFQGRAGGRIHLVTVVRLNHFDIDVVAKCPGCKFKQSQGDIDADTHIRRPHDRRFFGKFGHTRLVPVGKPGCPDDGLATLVRTKGKIG